MKTALILALAAQVVSTVLVGASPTAAPTSGIVPWLVGETTVTIAGDNAFDGSLEVSNPIGSDVDTSVPGAVTVELLDSSCETEFSSTGEVVEISTSGYSGSPFEYSVTIDQTKIADDSDFVTFTDLTVEGVTSGQSTGEISFCTRVTTVEGPIEVAFRHTLFVLSFDLTVNGFDIQVSVSEPEIDSFVTEVINPFTVFICQCIDFACVTVAQAIVMNTAVVLCLTPGLEGSSSKADIPVKMGNFNLEMSTDTGVTYNPVVFGSNQEEADPLTQVDKSDDTTQVTAPAIASFFTTGATELTVEGNAFLEFKGSDKTQRMPEFASFAITLDIELPTEEGCLQKLMNRVKDMFKNLPDVDEILPDIKLPDVPEFPDIKLPDVPEFPDIKLPDVPDITGLGDKISFP